MFNPFLVPAVLSALMVSWHYEFPVLFYCALKEIAQKKDVTKDPVVCPFPSFPCASLLPFSSASALEKGEGDEGREVALHLWMCCWHREEGWQRVHCVPPALYHLLCPLPSSVIISMCLLHSFSLHCLSNMELHFSAPPVLPASCQCLKWSTVEMARTVNSWWYYLRAETALRTVLALKPQFKLVELWKSGP